MFKKKYIRWAYKTVVLCQFMLKKTCAVVKARIGMEEVEVTAFPTRYCANLQNKKTLQEQELGARCCPQHSI